MGIKDRINRVSGIPDEYRAEITPAPISVKVELTAKCNYRCHFCATSKGLRAKGLMNFQLYKRLVDEMLEAGVEEIGVFYLGESFLYPQLAEAIQYTKDAGCKFVFLTTNGSIATPKKVEACMEAGLDSLKWSFNYADRDQFVDIARVKPLYYDRMFENIKAAYELREAKGYKCDLSASYIDYDGAQGIKMLEAIGTINPYVDEVYGLPLYNHADLTTSEELGRGWKPTPGNRGQLACLRDGLPCWTIFSAGHITFDGKLAACSFDHNGSFDMADLTKVPFMEGWNSLTFQLLRRAHLAKNVKGTACEACVAYL